MLEFVARNCWLIEVDDCSSVCGRCQVRLYDKFAINSGDLLIFYVPYQDSLIACCVACANNVNYQSVFLSIDTIVTFGECTSVKINLLDVLPQTFRLNRPGVTPLGAYCEQVISGLGIPASNMQCLQASSIRAESALEPLDCEIQVERYLNLSGYQVIRIPQGYQAGFDIIAWAPGHNKDDVYLIEVKSRTSILTSIQSSLMQKIRNDPCNVRNYLCGKYGAIIGLCQQYNLLTKCPYKVHFRVYRCFDNRVVPDKHYDTDGICRCQA